MNQELLHCLLGFYKELAKDTSVGYNPMSEFVPYVTTKEIVHTKIISELLNPAGCHKEGTKYLEAFFKFFLNPTKYDDYHDFKIIRERRVHRVLTEGSVRSIDVLIESKDNFGQKHAIIIENKLNHAEFQHLQIEDYSQGLAHESVHVDAVIILHDRYQHSFNNKYHSERTLYPKDLAEWINSVNPNHIGIKAYADYLITINNQNIPYENSRKMLDLSIDEIRDLYELNKAFENLTASKNDYIVEHVKEALPSGHSIETTFSTLDEGCKALQLWNQTDYDKTDLWIAVFHPGNPADDDNSTYVYLYTHDRKASNSEIVRRLGYEMQGSQEGYTYFRAPGDKCRFSFFDKPRRKQLIDEIVRLLKEIHELGNTDQP